MTNREQPRHEDRPEAWHVEKKIPLALIIAIAAQTAGFAWWAGGAANRIDTLEKQQAALAPQALSIARLEAKVEALAVSVGEIKDILRRPR